jgi:hypothetical protein
MLVSLRTLLLNRPLLQRFSAKAHMTTTKMSLLDWPLLRSSTEGHMTTIKSERYVIALPNLAPCWKVSIRFYPNIRSGKLMTERERKSGRLVDTKFNMNRQLFVS